VVAAATSAPARAQPCAGCLEAGAATAALRVPAGTSLAGYGSLARRLLLPDVLGRHPHAFWFKPSAGERDELAARALVLETRAARLVWVTVDLIAVDRAFTRDVERAAVTAGVRPARFIVSASHTHSGPGGFVDSTLFGMLALDRLDPTVRTALVRDVVDAVRRADAARVEARVGAASVAAPPVTVSRLRRPLDPELVVLKLTTAPGRPIALVWNYAIHGTMLGPRNLRLSGDVMGAASRELERALGVPALFVNGAVGDVSPQRHGDAAAGQVGRELAAAAWAGWNVADPVATDALAVQSATVELASPAVPLRNCLGRWVPRALRLPLGGALSHDAELVAAAVGDTAWVTIPGELQTALGQIIKEGARARWKHAFVAGVTNDYLGYFVTAEDYRRSTYITCATLYGPAAGVRLVAAAAELLSRLGAEGRSGRGR
jgi:hypothetical protein